MAYTDLYGMEEFPYRGKFYTMEIDESKPLDQREPTEVLVLEAECDIQEAGSNRTKGMIDASFSIYFPFDRESALPVRRGQYFHGEMYGMVVDGLVIGVFPTQLGGCTVYVKDSDTNK